MDTPPYPFHSTWSIFFNPFLAGSITWVPYISNHLCCYTKFRSFKFFLIGLFLVLHKLSTHSMVQENLNPWKSHKIQRCQSSITHVWATLIILVFSIIGWWVVYGPSKKCICIFPIKNRVLSHFFKYWFGLYRAKLWLVKVHWLFPSHPHVENSHPLGQCVNNFRFARLYARILLGATTKISYPPRQYFIFLPTISITYHLMCNILRIALHITSWIFF